MSAVNDPLGLGKFILLAAIVVLSLRNFHENPSNAAWLVTCVVSFAWIVDKFFT